MEDLWNQNELNLLQPCQNDRESLKCVYIVRFLQVQRDDSSKKTQKAIGFQKSLGFHTN